MSDLGISEGLLLSGLIGAGTSVASAAIGSNAANTAAQQQVDQQNKALDFQKQQWAATQANQAPFIQGGQKAFGQLSSMLTPASTTATANPGTGLMPAPVAGAVAGVDPGVPTGSGVGDPRQPVQAQQMPLSSMAQPNAAVPTSGQGGAVMMRSPTGQVASVPPDQVSAAAAKGAVRV